MPKENAHLVCPRTPGLRTGDADAQGCLRISANTISAPLSLTRSFYRLPINPWERFRNHPRKRQQPHEQIIIRVLDEAKGMSDVAFILGYISHCALGYHLPPQSSIP